MKYDCRKLLYKNSQRSQHAHMTDNSRLFSRQLSHALFPSVTLADGSTSSVLGSGTIHLTPPFSLSYVLHFPNLSFNFY